VAAFNGLVGGDARLSETEGWLFMVCLKMARATAGKLNVDDYVDGAGYMGLAGESAQMVLPLSPADVGGFTFDAPEPGPSPYWRNAAGEPVMEKAP
jgi:hypothetical protein